MNKHISLQHIFMVIHCFGSLSALWFPVVSFNIIYYSLQGLKFISGSCPSTTEKLDEGPKVLASSKGELFYQYDNHQKLFLLISKTLFKKGSPLTV